MKRTGREKVCQAAAVLLWVSIVSLSILSGVASGNGFDIYEHGAKVVGLAGAFTALADDPTGIAFNPAALSQLAGTQASLGATAIMPRTSFSSNGNPAMGTAAGTSWDSKDRTWIVPHAFFTQKINEKVSVGIGTYSPFGLGVEWPAGFEGRFTPGAVKAVMTTNSINPAISFKPTDRLSLGIAPYAQYFDIDLQNNAFFGIPAPPFTPYRNRDVTALVRLKGSTWGWGVNGGLLFRVTDSVTFGAAYMSEVQQRITGGTQDVTRLSDGALIRTQGFSGTIRLPASVRLGLVWKQSPWVISTDAWWTEWSSYKTLSADFADGSSLAVPKNWKNTWYWRSGIQYSVAKFLDLRAGFSWEDTPIPRTTLDPIVPSGRRQLYAGGVGIHLGSLTIDLGYNYIQDQSVTWNNTAGNVKLGSIPLTRVTGTFSDTYAHVLSGTLTYRF
jgi:long-chain fatty acid transport protein